MRKLLIPILFFITLSSAAQDTINHNGFNVFYYPSGKKQSEGTLENGRPNGYWINYYENGLKKSEGNRKNFELDSLWLFYSDSGKIVLTINYTNGKKNGIRTTYLKDETIEENFIEDVKNGTALHRFPDGKIKTKTSFINGREEGISKEYSKDGLIISLIEYKKGYVINSENINRYREGLKHGVWKEFYDNENVKWEGEYSYGKRDGYFKEFDIKGNLLKIEKYRNDELIIDAPELINYEVRTNYYKNGKVKIVQSYKDNIPEGIRREYTPEGIITKSFIFKNGIIIGEGVVDEKGMRQGPWKDFYESSEKEAEGIYLNNLRQGEWKFYFKNGKIEQTGKYNTDGKPDGKWKWYYESGNLRKEDNFKNGVFNGNHVELSDSGKVIVKGDYIDGEEEGEWIYEVGDEKELGSYVAGKREGEWKHYTGEMLNFEGSYIEGNPNGEFVYFWENGNVREKGKYIMGKKEGDWQIYDFDGIKIITIRYEDGVEISYDGNKIEKTVDK